MIVIVTKEETSLDLVSSLLSSTNSHLERVDAGSLAVHVLRVANLSEHESVVVTLIVDQRSEVVVLALRGVVVDGDVFDLAGDIDGERRIHHNGVGDVQVSTPSVNSSRILAMRSPGVFGWINSGCKADS